ncbi:hypothetical protein IH980_00625 [Patescibacteria group bacterium]|nr:hypothetical protein [Patescibacteria group bacterium]
MERENNGMEQLAMEGFMQRENGRNEQPIKGLPDRYVSPQTQPQYLDGVDPEEEMLKPYVSPQTPFVFKYPRIKRENRNTKQLLKSADLERENRRSDEQLLKGVLFRAISGAASNLAYYDPKERRGELVFRHYRVPTEHLIFPELETYFSANERDGAEAVLSIEFHKSRKEKVGIIRRKRVYTPERRELSIYFGIPEKVCAFSIEDIRRIKRKELDFFPPIPMDKWRSISLDKWRSRRTFETGDLEIADLHSFWKSLESALKKDDPQYLLKLEEQVLYV